MVNIFKKEIKELKIVSIILFISLLIFIAVFWFQLVSEGELYNPDSDKNYFEPMWDEHIINSFSIVLVAYSF